MRRWPLLRRSLLCAQLTRCYECVSLAKGAYVSFTPSDPSYATTGSTQADLCVNFCSTYRCACLAALEAWRAPRVKGAAAPQARHVMSATTVPLARTCAGRRWT